jgi:SHS2 domain-containing protein
MTLCTHEELGHTADIGLRVQAPDPAALLACAAQGMFALMRLEPGEQLDLLEIALDNSADFESLLVDWLNELLYHYETTGNLLDDIVVRHWSATSLYATAIVRRCAVPAEMQIKAVTYHQLRVAQSADTTWLAEVFFDI